MAGAGEQSLLNYEFEILFNNSSDGIIVHSKNKILNINPSFERISGFSKNDVIGKKLKKILKNGKLIGKDREINIISKSFTLGDKTITIIQDLSNVSEIEKNKLLLSALLEQNIVMKINDKTKIIEYINKDFLNYTKEEIIGKRIDELFNIKNQEFFEVSVKGKDGKEFYLHVNKKKIQNEIFLIVRDITRIKEIEEKIEKISEEYDDIVNNVSDIIFEMDKNGEIKFFNQQFEKQLGLNTKNIIPVIHPQDLPEFLMTVGKAEKEGKGFKELEFRIKNARGRYIYFSANCVPIKEKGVVVGFRGTLRNINEKKKKIDKVEKMKKELEIEAKRLSEINKLKSELVSTVSHDLKTPLTSIQGYSLLLANKLLGDLTPQQLDAVTIIHKECTRLAKMIDELLDLSKLESGNITLHKKRFLLSSLEEKCSCRQLAERKGLKLIWNTPDEYGECYGDPDRIAQVLINLISNAIKFTEKGTITVNSFPVKKGKKEYIQVDVIDTGIGIPEKELENIFQPYYKIGKKEGSGLGLRIAKNIVELHNGEIWVESKLGKGSKFSFTIEKYVGQDVMEESQKTEELRQKTE